MSTGLKLEFPLCVILSTGEVIVRCKKIFLVLGWWIEPWLLGIVKPQNFSCLNNIFYLNVGFMYTVHTYIVHMVYTEHNVLLLR